MATTLRKRVKPSLPDRHDRPCTSLFGALLSGLFRGLACGVSSDMRAGAHHLARQNLYDIRRVALAYTEVRMVCAHSYA